MKNNYRTGNHQNMMLVDHPSNVHQNQQLILQHQSMTSVGLKSPQTLSSYSMMQETPHVRMRDSVWDDRSRMEDDDGEATCREDLERTASIDLRKQFDFVLSPNTSEIRVFGDKR